MEIKIKSASLSVLNFLKNKMIYRRRKENKMTKTVTFHSRGYVIVLILMEVVISFLIVVHMCGRPHLMCTLFKEY